MLFESLEDRRLLAVLTWSGDIADGTVWKGTDIHHVVGDVQVPAGASLSIEPGAIVKFGSFSYDLRVQGSLLASGSAANPIVFTSYRDDVGGDTNGDGDASVPAPSEWGRIDVEPGGMASIEHSQIRYGGFNSLGMVTASGTLTLQDSLISHAAGNAVRIVSADPLLTNNRYEHNSGAAISMDLASNPSIQGVTLVDNRINGLLIDSGAMENDGFWNDPEIVYVTDGDITVAAGKTLSLAPGQVVKFRSFSYDLFVNGTLDAQGTSDQRITFTDFRDDTAGGDTNNDGSDSSASASNWGRVELVGPNSVLSHVDFRYGGFNSPGQLFVNGGSLVYSDGNSDHSSTAGIRIANSNPRVTRIGLHNNAGAAMSMDLASNPTISNNGPVDATGNGTNGLLLDAGAIDTDAFWDDPDIVYVTNGDITLSAGKTLKLAPGQIVKFRSFSYDLFVNGTLDAQGTSDRRITFTDFRDDTAGGDTNNDGSDSSASASNWGRVELVGPNSMLSHVDFRYGGFNSPGQLFVNGGSLVYNDGNSDHSSAAGIRIANSNPNITRVGVHNNAGAAMSMDLASNPTIRNNGPVEATGNGTNGLLLDAGAIDNDGFWDDPDIVYVLNGDITLSAGKTLQLAPGQVVKFRSFSYDLLVNGTLDAQGTRDRRITFTDFRDDAAGGDTNNDGVASSPSASNWGRVELVGPNSVLSHVDFRYGGFNSPGQLFVNGGSLVYSDGNSDHSRAAGIRIANSSPNITRVGLHNNAGAAVSMDLASNPTIVNSGPVDATGNGTNGLLLDAGAIDSDAFWDDPDIVYVTNGDITVSAGKTLKLAPGQIVKFRSFSYDLFVDGALDAQGTADHPITFTDFRDDAAGGDTNNDAGSSTPSPNNWGAIAFKQAGNKLRFAEIQYGGFNAQGMITVDGGQLELSESMIRNSGIDGVHGTNSATVELVNNFIVNNLRNGVQASAGATIAATNNTIDGNVRGAVSEGAQSSINLTNNLITFHSRSGVFSSNGALATLNSNDVYNPQASQGNYETISDATGSQGNISADPLYVDRNALDFNLSDNSPAVDAGNGTLAPASDAANNLRIDDPAVANTGSGVPDYADIGALERDRWFSNIISPTRSGQIVAGDTLRLVGNGNASPAPTRFAWTLGDGRTSTFESPGLVTFGTLGTKSLTFRAIGADGNSDPRPDTRDITVVADTGSLPDLDVTQIILPNGLSLGQATRVDYSVKNMGDANVPATSRVDALYFSTDAFLDSGDLLLTSHRVSQSVPSGETRSGSFTATIPDRLLASGVHYLIVSVDDQWEILERQQLNNEEALLTTAAIPSLELGVASSGTFSDSGEGKYFQVEVPQNNFFNVVFEEGPTKAGVNELYIRYGSPPTRTEYDARSTELGSFQSLFSSAPIPGTWFILAYRALGVGGNDFSLTANAGDIYIDAVSPSKHSRLANTELTITGAGFGPGTSVDLIATSDGTIFPAEQVIVDSFNSVRAVFSGATLPAEFLTVRVHRKGETAELHAGFRSVALAARNFEAHLTIPASLGYHALATIWVEFENTGDTTISAPLLAITGTQSGEKGALMTLDASIATRGLWTPSIPEGFSNSIQFLASGAIPGELQPGERMRVPIYYAGWQTPWDFSYPKFQFGLGVLDETSTEVINWNELADNLRPTNISDSAWDIVFENFKSEIGNTWGEFLSTIDANAQYLGRLGARILDISDLASFVFRQVDGLGPVDTLATALDAQVDSPGLQLFFARGFPSRVSTRYELGSLGYGWTHVWETRAVVDTDGSVVIHEGGLEQRIFQPDIRRAGRFFSEVGDDGILTQRIEGGFLLTEFDGQRSAFSADGQLEYHEDLFGNRITATFLNNRVTRLEHSSGASLAIAYNSENRIASITTSDSEETLYSYDSTGEHLVRVDYPDGGSIAYSYDANHAPTEITLPNNSQIFYSYDSLQRLASVRQDGQTDPVFLAYGPQGQISATIGPDTGHYFFDHRGALAKLSNPLAESTSLRYDNAGNLVRSTDASGASTTSVYDHVGNLLAATDSLGSTTSFTYDRFHRARTITDANFNRTDYIYDANENLTQIVRPDGSSEGFEYDARGNVTHATNRRGQSTVLTVDDQSRVTQIDKPSATPLTYTYDAVGNLIQTSGAAGATSFTYDANNFLTRADYTDGRFLAFTYNVLGQRTSLADQTGFTLHYTYTASGHLATISDTNAQVIVEYTYDSNGRLARESKGNGTYTQTTYDAAGRIRTLVNHAADNSVLSRRDYSYDEVGRQSEVDTSQGLWSYAYDRVGRLIHAVFTSTDSRIPDQEISYEYDAVGNRTATHINGVTEQYIHNNLNQVSQAGDVAFTYDADGNLLTRTENSKVTTYTYDALNRLVEVVSPNGTEQYEYDAFDNRVAVTRDGVRTEYMVDPLGSDIPFAVYDSGGNLASHYVQGYGLTGQFDALGAAYYYDFDATGSTIGLSDSTGAYINEYAYRPFGESLLASESIATPFQYIGQFGVETDRTGSVHMHARDYSPQLGRFFTEDPLGQTVGANLYEYAHNNPLSFTDVSGFKPNYSTSDAWNPLSFIKKTLVDASGNYFDVAAALDKVSAGIERDNFGSGRTHAESARYQAEYQRKRAQVNVWSERWVMIPDLVSIASGKLDAATTALGKARDWVVDEGPQFNPRESLRNARTSLGTFFNNTRDAWNRLEFPEVPAVFKDLFTPDPVQSRDPNDKISLAGFGAANYVSSGTRLPYRINFENDASATAPAQVVTIVDTLPPELDISTFSITEVGFGDVLLQVPGQSSLFRQKVNMQASSGVDIYVEIEVGIRPATREVYATFYTFDQATGLPPEVLTGFLPPEDDTGRGQGFFSFAIDPVAGLATGTEIRNIAEIQFDFSTTIATNQVDPHDPSAGTDPAKESLVTLDAAPPTSFVNALPIKEGRTFSVSWQGVDDAGGSGVGTYDVYVSIDHADAVLWLSGSQATEANYIGERGRHYAFYSIATDAVGNREAAPLAYDASTQVTVHLWQNPGPAESDKYDVNGDNLVSPIDVLLIINELNLTRARPLSSDPNSPEQPPPYLDTSGDDFLSPLDVLLIINYINAHPRNSSNSSSSGEQSEIPETLESLAIDEIMSFDLWYESDWTFNRKKRLLI